MIDFFIQLVCVKQSLNLSGALKKKQFCIILSHRYIRGPVAARVQRSLPRPRATSTSVSPAPFLKKVIHALLNLALNSPAEAFALYQKSELLEIYSLAPFYLALIVDINH